MGLNTLVVLVCSSVFNPSRGKNTRGCFIITANSGEFASILLISGEISNISSRITSILKDTTKYSTNFPLLGEKISRISEAIRDLKNNIKSY